MTFTRYKYVTEKGQKNVLLVGELIALVITEYHRKFTGPRNRDWRGSNNRIQQKNTQPQQNPQHHQTPTTPNMGLINQQHNCASQLLVRQSVSHSVSWPVGHSVGQSGSSTAVVRRSADRGGGRRSQQTGCGVVYPLLNQSYYGFTRSHSGSRSLIQSNQY